MKRVIKTTEQKAKIVAKIDSDRASGMQMGEAVDKAGIQASQYYKWQKDSNPKVIGYQNTAIKKPIIRMRRGGSTTLSLVVGSPQQIAEFMRLSHE